MEGVRVRVRVRVRVSNFYTLNPWGRGGGGTFFKLQVSERVRISLVDVYERVGKSVFSVCQKTKKG